VHREGVALLADAECLLGSDALGDVDQDAVVGGAPGVRVADGGAGVEHRPDLAVGPSDLELELVDGAVAGEEFEFAVAESGLHHQVVGAVARQLLARLDAEHREEGGIAVEEVALLVGDVDAFAEVAHEGVQGGGIIEGAAAPAWHLV